MKTYKLTLLYICFFAGVLFLCPGCGTNQTNSSATCDCDQMTLSNNEEDGMIVNTEDAIALNANYVNYLSTLYTNAGITSNPSDFVKGGRIKKADLIAIINSLPADQVYMNFGFGRADATLETPGSTPYAKTYVLFYGGDLNPCNNSDITNGQMLIYRNGYEGGFCPPMCDTGAYTPTFDGSGIIDTSIRIVK